MPNEIILTIMLLTALVCYGLERRVAWIMHISAVCLIILVAMSLSQIGIIPTRHLIYDFFYGKITLVAIALMIVGLRLSDVVKIPWKVGGILLFSIIGTLCGGIVAGLVGYYELGEAGIALAAQLTASYTGGGENAVAMQKMFNINHEQFVAIFAVDNILTSLWMLITIWFARDWRGELGTNLGQPIETLEERPATIVSLLGSFAIGLSLVTLAEYLAVFVGGLHKVLWMSVLGITIGQIKFLRVYTHSSYLIGSTIFAGFFFSIGATTDFSTLANIPRNIVMMPIIVIAIHAIFVLLGQKLLGISNIVASIASQAMIGGPATAVALAQVRNWKEGVPLGIILGLLGYAIGNFCGVFVYYFIRLIYNK